MTTTALKVYEKWKIVQIGDYFHLMPWNCQLDEDTYLVDGKIIHSKKIKENTIIK